MKRTMRSMNREKFRLCGWSSSGDRATCLLLAIFKSVDIARIPEVEFKCVGKYGCPMNESAGRPASVRSMTCLTSTTRRPTGAAGTYTTIPGDGVSDILGVVRSPLVVLSLRCRCACGKEIKANNKMRKKTKLS